MAVEQTHETICDNYPNRQNDENDLNYELEEAVSSGSSDEDNDNRYTLEHCNAVDQLQPKLRIFIDSMQKINQQL